MWGVVEALVFFEHLSQHVLQYWEQVKEHTRQYLGPSPNTMYLLFENDEVIPEARQHCKYAPIAQYNPQEQRLTYGSAPHKRLPWISVQHIIGDHTIDLSDWMADIRTNVPISLLALLRLASLTQNLHLPECSHAKVLVLNRDGEEEEYVFTKACLVKKQTVQLQHRPTLPFDTGALFF